MKALQALGSGLIGACALTLLHETVRRFAPNAPRVDILGMQAIAKGLRASGQSIPNPKQLHQLALTGDLISNGLYYSLVGFGKGNQPVLLGAALGAAAGLGAVTLPGPLGLSEQPSARTPATAAMTIGWYLVGGLVAGTAYQLLQED